MLITSFFFSFLFFSSSSSSSFLRLYFYKQQYSPNEPLKEQGVISYAKRVRNSSRMTSWSQLSDFCTLATYIKEEQNVYCECSSCHK